MRRKFLRHSKTGNREGCKLKPWEPQVKVWRSPLLVVSTWDFDWTNTHTLTHTHTQHLLIHSHTHKHNTRILIVTYVHVFSHTPVHRIFHSDKHIFPHTDKHFHIYFHTHISGFLWLQPDLSTFSLAQPPAWALWPQPRIPGPLGPARPCPFTGPPL